jgi:hypothetical protein
VWHTVPLLPFDFGYSKMWQEFVKTVVITCRMLAYGHSNETDCLETDCLDSLSQHTRPLCFVVILVI